MKPIIHHRREGVQTVSRAVLFFVALTSLTPKGGRAQWRDVLDLPFGLSTSTIYFLDVPGPPKIGFEGSATDATYKTTDGGFSWQPQYAPFTKEDFTFKDSLTGWVAAEYTGTTGIFKTTDGGQTWFPLPMGNPIYAIHYDPISGGLFASGFAWYQEYTSWDEGDTWIEQGEDYPLYLGFAFNDGLHGTLAAIGPWLNTSDGGHTWESIGMDSEVWQPLPIERTSTLFACPEHSAVVLRSDDAGDNWRTIYRFPIAAYDGFAMDSLIQASGCMAGDSCHLFVQRADGCYLSTDMGTTWSSLGNIPMFAQKLLDTRFYSKEGVVYIGVR